MPQTKTELIAVRLTGQEFDAVQQAASLLDVTASEVIRRALADYLDHLADADARKLEAQQ